MADFPKRYFAAHDARRPPATRSAAAYVPSCVHYPQCVGCPWIDVPYPEQLARKRARVSEALGGYQWLAGIEVPPVVPAPQRLAYRTRVKLVVRRNRNLVATGLYIPQSHRVVDISSCAVHPREINQVVQYLKKKILELRIAPYDERDDSGDLRYLDFRFSVARRELSVTLVTRHAAFPAGAALARSLTKRFRFITGVMQNINDQRGNVIWGPSFRTLAGRETLMERIGDLKLVFPPGVFSQANPTTAHKLYAAVAQMAALQGRETVLDLYCGVGPISLGLTAGARQVWGIDENEIAIHAAKQNARRNGRGNCRFVAGDVASMTVQLDKDLPQIDLVVVNPPRKGLQPAALQAILDVAAPRVIYVSCEPATFARDLNRLVEASYKIERLQLFDMFPQTEQVESLALLVRA